MIHGVTAKVTYNDQVRRWGQEMSSWTVELTYEGRRMRVPFYMGLGITGEPTVNDVLECLLSDASSWEEYGDDPDAWVAALGEPDSIKDLLDTIKAVEHQTSELRYLLDDDYEAFLYSESS